MKARIKVYRGDYGYNIPVSTGFDVSTASSLELVCTPYVGGSTKTITCTAASTEEITAPVTEDFFDRDGLWEAQAKITFASSVRYGAEFEIEVLDQH